jgi:hypothetical protein
LGTVCDILRKGIKDKTRGGRGGGEPTFKFIKVDPIIVTEIEMLPGDFDVSLVRFSQGERGEGERGDLDSFILFNFM